MPLDANPSVEAASAERVADERLLDAALWRIYMELAPHWLHALRGSLNAISLNLVLLGASPSGTVRPPGDPAWHNVKAQVRELDAGLTRLLDRGSLESGERAEIVSIVNGVGALFEPFARKHQVALEVGIAEPGAWAAIGPAMLHGIVILVAHRFLKALAPRSTLAMRVRLSSSRIELDVEGTPPTPSAPAESDGTVLLAGRLLRASGGDLTLAATPDAETWRVILKPAAPRTVSS